MSVTLVLLIVLAACIAMMWNEGTWSNAITMVNVILAATLASNYFEPVATWLEGMLPDYTYIWDFLAIWGLFAGCFGILRMITDRLSTLRVPFMVPVEHAGRVIFAMITGWVMVCFTAMSLHTAPLGREAFAGSLHTAKPSDRIFLGLGPDVKWLGYMQSRSRGALARGDSKAESPNEKDKGMRVFDPEGEFVLKYDARRTRFQEEKEYRVLRGKPAK